MTLPLREDLHGLRPYGAPQLSVPVCLNVNENPYAPSQAVIDDIAASVAQAASTLNRYPDRDFGELRAALAGYLKVESGVDVDPGHVWAANGSNEVMLHILQAFGGPGRTVMSFAPTYSMYHEYARDTNTQWIQGQRNGDFTLNVAQAIEAMRQHRPAVVLLASPNNPTGTALPLDEVREILQAARNTGPMVTTETGEQVQASTIVVIDEAYAEFRRAGTDSALTLLADNEHLIVSRTMSKAFAMAGLRLGYMVSSVAIRDQIMLVRLPYHLSAVTQAAALAALRHAPELMEQIAHLRDLRDDFAVWLSEQGYEVTPSDANFVLFGGIDNRDAVFQALLDRGILIRVVGPDGYLRASIGTDDEMRQLKAALLEVGK